MKTSLNQHVMLVHDIRNADSIPLATTAIRRWLEASGYENVKLCQHYAIARGTGRCISCGKAVVV